MIATALPFTLTRPLVSFDLETTGVDTRKDRIVEISLRLYHPGADSPDVKTRRLNPGIPIPKEATAVHGITDEDVVDRPTFRQIAEDLLLTLDGCDLIGANIRRFDLPLLCAEFERCGMRFEHIGRRIIDVQNIFHREEPRDLAAASEFYLGRPLEGAHSAEDDALTAADVLFAQVERYGLSTDLDELHAFCDEMWKFETEREKWWDTSDEDPKRWVFKRGKHKGVELGKVDRSYLHWMSAKAEDMPVDVVEVAHNLLFGRYG